MTTATTNIVENPTKKLDRHGKKGIVTTFCMIFIQLTILLIFAGKVDWINAWVFTILMVSICMATFLFLLKINPELLNERGKFVKEDTKPFDKLFFMFWRLFNIAFAIIAGLDSVRYEWSHMKAEFAVIGIMLTIVAQCFMLWAMAVNTHFEATVRIQDDRNHQVCTAGPYKFVRHPGYLAFILSTLAAPFILGSWWSLVPAGMIAVLVIIRTALEDRTLLQELAGYAQYTKITRYRLVPFVW
jgi:protein-S-isoprenylcysteine O-methyltransferase Ste14